MNSRRDIQPSDSAIEPLNSGTSSINNAQPVATSTPSGRSRRLSNSGTSKSLDVKPETKRVIFQEPEPQAGSLKTPNAGRKIPKTYAQIRGRGPIRAPKSPAKPANTPKKAATPKKTRTPKKIAYTPRVPKQESKDIVNECEKKNAPIGNQTPRRKALKRLNGTGATTPARRTCLEVFSINMRSPFTMLRKKEIIRVTIDDNDEDTKKVNSDNLAVNLPQIGGIKQESAPIDGIKQESAPLPEPLATEPKMETSMVSVMKVEPKTTYCDVSTNTSTTDLSKINAEPQPGCVVM